MLLAFINWVNRGAGDGFDDAYGALAGAARQVVDVAIADWSFVVQNFNYGDSSHPNEFQLDLRAADTKTYGTNALGFTWLTQVDSEGKPYKANIVLDDDASSLTGGWFIAEKWLGEGAFVDHDDYSGEYSFSPVFRRPYDIYTTVLHELGHAVGIAVGDGLKLEQFLTPIPGMPGASSFRAGSPADPTTATFFDFEGGGHIGAVVDLMNSGQGAHDRKLISLLDARILRDAYGYTVWDPTDLVKIGVLPPYWTQYCTYYDLTLEPGFGCTIQAISFPSELDPIADQTVDEGSPLSFSATARDANPGEIFVFSLDPGAPAGATINANTGAFSWTPTDGDATATITVRVGDNGSSGSSDTETFTVTVNNVPPAAGVSGPALGVRGQPITFNLYADDPSVVDEAAGFTYLVNWGDGEAVQSIGPDANNGAGLLLDHAFTLNGTYTARVTATDKDGAPSDEATHSITIASTAVLPDPGNPNAMAFFVGGTTGNDDIRVTPRGISVNGVNTAIPSGTARLVFYGQDGNDDIHVNGSINLPVIIDGGAGNDRITGGRGNDILIGGPDNDELKGHLGRDILIGGLGSDVLQGQHGDDILIGGATVHDNNLAALSKLMDEWSRPDLGYVQRESHLRTGGAGALNGTVLLDALSLIDDALEDQLNGGPGDNLLL